MFRTILCVVSLICGDIGLIWSYLKCSKSQNDCLLKNVMRAVAISQLLALTFNIVNLFIGTVAVDWSSICQFFGMSTLILTSGATWVLAVVAIERYFRFILPGDHESTFSVKNLFLLIAGMYVLVILISTGPLYGLGEFSYYRGHVTISSVPYSTFPNMSSAGRNSVARGVAQLLHQGYIGNKNQSSALRSIAVDVQERFGLTVSRQDWSETGPVFILRTIQDLKLEQLLAKYENGDIDSFIWKRLPSAISIFMEQNFVNFSVFIGRKQVEHFQAIYIPAQGLCHCSVDFTSPRVNANLWSIYQLLINSVLPHIIACILYIVIFYKNPYSMRAQNKHLRDEDISSLKILCMTSFICFAVSIIYHGIILSNAYGVYIPVDAMFVVTLVYCLSGTSLTMASVLYHTSCFKTSNPCHRCRNSEETLRHIYNTKKDKFRSAVPLVQVRKKVDLNEPIPI